MKTFEFLRPANPAAAVATAAQAKTAQQGADVRFLAGGTTLLDLMKLNVETPARLLDINRLPLDKIEATPGGGLKIGAPVRNAEPRNRARVGRSHHARDAAAPRRGRQADISEAARQGVLRIRPGVGGRRNYGRGRKRDSRARRAGRCGNQAVALP